MLNERQKKRVLEVICSFNKFYVMIPDNGYRRFCTQEDLNKIIELSFEYHEELYNTFVSCDFEPQEVDVSDEMFFIHNKRKAPSHKIEDQLFYVFRVSNYNSIRKFTELYI